ncbi:hypothetical protein A2U01_0018573, partial [Trifolium medium]|nr:hypothetical protein [Trifolium medium]
YERLPEYCYHCFSIGHSVANCHKLYPNEKLEEKGNKEQEKPSKQYVPKQIIVLVHKVVQAQPVHNFGTLEDGLDHGHDIEKQQFDTITNHHENAMCTMNRAHGGTVQHLVQNNAEVHKDVEDDSSTTDSGNVISQGPDVVNIPETQLITCLKPPSHPNDRMQRDTEIIQKAWEDVEARRVP